MVHFLTRIGADVVPGARVLAGRSMAGILERVVLVHRRPVDVVAIAMSAAPVRLTEDWLVVAAAGLLAERGGQPAVPAPDLLLVLLVVAAAGLLAERGGQPAVPAPDLLLVLLVVAAAGLLAERGGQPAVPAPDLLLVLLVVAAAGLLAERGGQPAVPAPDLLLVLLVVAAARPAR